MAANDTGPLRHRYGGMRDLVVGATVALSDGTLARSGGKVIKNVAGYDLAKLFTGSLGTLGLITQLAVRLHPLPAATASAVGSSDDAERLGDAAIALARHPLEADCLDVDWRDGAGPPARPLRQRRGRRTRPRRPSRGWRRSGWRSAPSSRTTTSCG